MTTPAAGFVVSGRTIFTYVPDGRTRGVLTGYVNGDAFVVEHVIVCPGAAPTTLRAMLQAGLAEAWRAGHQRVTFMLPEDDERLPDAPALGRLALGLGFLPFATQDGVTWWTRWRP